MRSDFSHWFKTHRILLLTWSAGFFLLCQVLNLHTYVAQAVDHQSIVASNDDDAAWNVAKTVKTRWWKDNGWVLYGPAYFRLNHTLNYFWARTAEPVPGDNWERTAHHAILTVSLLSVVGLSLLIAAMFLPFWWQRFLFASAMTAALLNNAVWDEFVLRAHPDMLFSFVIAAALALTIRWFRSPNERIWFLLSAVLWGLSVSVKMTLSLCAPGFVLLFIPPLKNYKQGLKYLGVMLLSYFLVGFPQTIVLDRPFRELANINGLSAPPTLETALHRLFTYADQLKEPLLILALALVCFQGFERKWKGGGQWRVAAFVALPFVILLFKNMLVPSDHYTIPFVSLLLVALPAYLPSGRWAVRSPVLCTTVFVALALALVGTTPETLQASLNERLRCRTEAREVYGKVSELAKAGAKIWVDPYVPYPTSSPKDRVELSWEKTWAGFDAGQWTVLALNSSFVHRFTEGAEPDAYTQKDIPNWRAVREFYQAFVQGDSATAPSGIQFSRIYKNNCSQEIWQRR